MSHLLLSRPFFLPRDRQALKILHLADPADSPESPRRDCNACLVGVAEADILVEGGGRLVADRE